MKSYHIKDDFIAILWQFDSKVSENKNQTRPYVGIVLEEKYLQRAYFVGINKNLSKSTEDFNFPELFIKVTFEKLSD